VAAADASEAAAEPRVSETGINGDGLVEVFKSFAGIVACGEEEAFKSEGLGVARGESEAAFEGFHGFGGTAEAELELGDAFPCESKFGRNLDGSPRQLERVAQRFITVPERLF